MPLWKAHHTGRNQERGFLRGFFFLCRKLCLFSCASLSAKCTAKCISVGSFCLVGGDADIHTQSTPKNPYESFEVILFCLVRLVLFLRLALNNLCKKTEQNLENTLRRYKGVSIYRDFWGCFRRTSEIHANLPKSYCWVFVFNFFFCSASRRKVLSEVIWGCPGVSLEQPQIDTVKNSATVKSIVF